MTPLPTVPHSRMLAVACVLLLLVLPASLVARDTDGSRLGADEHVLGRTDADSLAPPDDTIDWRYVEIESEHTVVVTLSPDSDETEVEVALTKATGDELDSTATEGDDVTLEHSVTPGLYYVSVTAGDAVDYEITIE